MKCSTSLARVFWGALGPRCPPRWPCRAIAGRAGVGYIRRKKEGTFGYIRVHSGTFGYIRARCAPSRLSRNPTKTSDSWNPLYSPRVHSPQPPIPFIKLKRGNWSFGASPLSATTLLSRILLGHWVDTLLPRAKTLMAPTPPHPTLPTTLKITTTPANGTATHSSSKTKTRVFYFPALASFPVPENNFSDSWRACLDSLLAMSYPVQARLAQALAAFAVGLARPAHPGQR